MVAGASGGVGEIIEPEVTGLLVAAGDARAFAAAVRSVILNYDRRQTLAEAARRRILLEHDLRAATRRLAAVIDAVAGARTA